MTLIIEDLNVTLNQNHILKDISLQVKKGEYLALLGPSGSGKTTLLKSLAGLIDQVQGQLVVADKDLTKLPAHRRPLSVVFQDLRLFPHYTVAENIAFPMKLKGLEASKIEKRINQLLNDVQLPDFGAYSIHKLSGGQQQRIALARALAADPQILLLDEPFSGLDEPLRREMGQLVYQLHRGKNLTTILVTHDKREALEFADQIAFMFEGELLQVGSPKTIIDQPRNRYIGSFFGKLNQIEEDVFVRPSKIKLGQGLVESTDYVTLQGCLVHRVDYPEYVELQFEVGEVESLWTVNVPHQIVESLEVGVIYQLQVAKEALLRF